MEIPSARLWKLQFLVVRDVFVEVHFLWCFYAEFFKKGFDSSQCVLRIETDFGIFVDGFAEGDQTRFVLLKLLTNAFKIYRVFHFQLI